MSRDGLCWEVPGLPSRNVNGGKWRSSVFSSGAGVLSKHVDDSGVSQYVPYTNDNSSVNTCFGGVNQDNQWLSWEVYFAGGRLILDFKDKLGCQRKKFQKSEDKSYRLKTGMGLVSEALRFMCAETQTARVSLLEPTCKEGACLGTVCVSRWKTRGVIPIVPVTLKSEGGQLVMVSKSLRL